MTFTASSSSRAVTDSPVVVALDYANRDKALAFVDRIDPRDCRLKVGKEMFTLLDLSWFVNYNNVVLMSFLI